jgi:thioredoxin reductase
MSEREPTQPLPGIAPDPMFPTLTPVQQARVADRGTVRQVQPGETLVEADEHGFIKTGSDLSSEDLAAARWPLARVPFLLETSLPGVFAVGDVRGGNIKRVASAVGEGSIAVAFVHQVLSE